VLAVVAAAWLVWVLDRPEHAALGLLAALPFLIYPATVRQLSVFAGVPLVLSVSLSLLLAQSGSAARLHDRLAIGAFAVLLVAAGATAAHSLHVSTAASRVLYLVMFGLFAWALAASMTARRLELRSVAGAIVLGAALASFALIIQVLVQFVAGQHGVTNWLTNEFALFGGQKGAAIPVQQRDWVVGSLNVIRGIFPFMAAPSAGQYTMMGLVAAVWLWRERGPRASASHRVRLTLAMAVIGGGLLATFSRQSWVGAVAGVIALSLRRGALKPVVAAVALLGVLALVPVPGMHSSLAGYLVSAGNTASTSSGGRLSLLIQAIHLIPRHLVIGVGPGLYETLNPNPANPVYYAHNVWLDEIVELGIVGGLALIAVFVLAMRSAFRRGATLGFALLAAYAVANLFDDVLYFPRNGILLGAAFALAAGYDRRSDAQASTRSAPE
jgi:O-antigen ligase